MKVSRILCQDKKELCSFELQVEDETDVRWKIAAKIKQSPWLLTEITGVHLSLEDIFLKLTGKKEGRKQ
ncbi:MAG: hypothetical protein ACLUUO_20330 [Sellimonas intestinalis]